MLTQALYTARDWPQRTTRFPVPLLNRFTNSSDRSLLSANLKGLVMHSPQISNTWRRLCRRKSAVCCDVYPHVLVLYESVYQRGTGMRRRCWLKYLSQQAQCMPQMACRLCGGKRIRLWVSRIQKTSKSERSACRSPALDGYLQEKASPVARQTQ